MEPRSRRNAAYRTLESITFDDEVTIVGGAAASARNTSMLEQIE
jgi:hypothetical protein